MSSVRQVTEQNFDSEVCGSSQPVLVDFYTPWCNPCKEVSPILEQIAGEWVGRLKVVKVDASEDMELAVRYGVTAVPTIVHLKDCREIARVSGAMPKQKLLDSLSLT